MIRNFDHIGDDELLQHYRKSGDLLYWATLYKRYMPLVYGVALKYLKKSEDAQDLVMQLFEELSLKVRTSEVKAFKGWLYTCVRNSCLMELRKIKRDRIVNLDDSFMDFCDDFHLEQEGDEARDKALKVCMEQLPEKQRCCLYHFFFECCSYRDVEEKTGFSYKMVKSFIQNGKRNLKSCLQSKGFNVHGAE